jgi:hypothetical protein
MAGLDRNRKNLSGISIGTKPGRLSRIGVPVALNPSVGGTIFCNWENVYERINKSGYPVGFTQGA